jgi:hypothetical protein
MGLKAGNGQNMDKYIESAVTCSRRDIDKSTRFQGMLLEAV